jgi:hypothetical protein
MAGDTSPYNILGKIKLTSFDEAAAKAPLLLLSSFICVTLCSSVPVGSEFTPIIGILSSKKEAVFNIVPSPPTAIIKSLSSKQPRCNSSRPTTL